MKEYPHIKIYIEPHHRQRVAELRRATGLSISGLVRALLDNASLEQVTTYRPTTVLPVRERQPEPEPGP